MSLESTRHENLKRNAELFASLELDDLKANLQRSAERRRSLSVKKKIVKRPEEKKVMRRSLRLLNAPAVNYKDDAEDDATSQLDNIDKALANARRAGKFGSLVNEDPIRLTSNAPAGAMSLEDCMKAAMQEMSVDDFVNSFVTDVDKTFDRNAPSDVDLDSFVTQLQALRMDENCFTKILTSRATSVTFHPAADKALVIAGGRLGYLAMWDASKRGEGLLLRPHGIVVSMVAVHPQRPRQIVSTSYDGRICVTDFEKKAVAEAYVSDVEVNSMDFIGPNAIVMGQRNGYATFLDLRAKEKEAGISLMCNEGNRACTVKSISVHPVKHNVIATATNAGHVILWDQRHTSKWLSFLPHIRTVQWCEFSPVNGTSLLTSSSSDQIRIYDTSEISMTYLSEYKPKRTIFHNNNTGRFVTPFRPRWFPHREDCFVVGSMGYPREAEIFNAVTGKKVARMQSEWLNSIHSLWVFHPTHNILAGCNSSGKASVFIPENA